MTKRPTNQELCAAFRTLLTEGARDVMGVKELEYTKPWRNELWQAFRELEERLCPSPEIARRYVNHDKFVSKQD